MQAEIINEFKVIELLAKDNTYFDIEFEDDILSITEKATGHTFEVGAENVKVIEHITANTKMIKSRHGSHLTFSLLTGYLYMSM